MAHRVHDYLVSARLSDGDKLFPMLKPAMTLKIVINALILMSVPGAQSMTWKSIRAGHATHMAASGATLAAILEAGEWRSAAFLNYIDSNVADSTEVLRQSLQAELDSESED